MYNRSRKFKRTALDQLFSYVFLTKNKALSKFPLCLENKTIFEISKQLKEKISNKELQLKEINQNVYTRNNLKELKQILTELK